MKHKIIDSMIFFVTLLDGTYVTSQLPHLEVECQVADALEADGARVAVQRVLAEAAAVHEVATGQLLHGCSAREQVIVADGTIRLHRALTARVPALTYSPLQTEPVDTVAMEKMQFVQRLSAPGHERNVSVCA
jgi:hypothetical protein